MFRCEVCGLHDCCLTVAAAAMHVWYLAFLTSVLFVLVNLTNPEDMG